MTTMIRWNPVREISRMQRDLDRMFDTVFVNGNGGSTLAHWGVRLNVAETSDDFLITAAVPGMNVNDLDITFADSVLTIRGEYNHVEDHGDDVHYHLQERPTGDFARAITLPVAVNIDAVEAEYVDGILTLNLPKAEAIKPKRIVVKHSGSKSSKLLEHNKN